MTFGVEANKEIRNRIAAAGLRYYQVAHVVGVNEPTFSRWLHAPMTAVQKARTIEAIDKLIKAKGA